MIWFHVSQLIVSKSTGTFKLTDLSGFQYLYTSCHQVKRLFDTFHEPFKRVDSSWQSIPETSVQNKAESPKTSAQNHGEPSTNEDDVNKRRKKESELTVKSALSAAFAKYADRVGKKDSPSEGKKGESSVVMESKGD